MHAELETLGLRLALQILGANWEGKDFVAFAALLLGLYNLWHSIRKDRRQGLQTRVLAQIDELKTLCRKVSAEIVTHVTFAPGRKSREDIYRMEKDARELRESLQMSCPSVVGDLSDWYTDWWSKVSGDFPVDKKVSAYKSTSPQVDQIEAASKAMSRNLEKLVFSVIRGKVALS